MNIIRKTVLLCMAGLCVSSLIQAAAVTETGKSRATIGRDGSETPEGLIVTPPKGQTKTYYMDLLTHDEAVGFIGDYHNRVNITFCENGEVYVPNAVYRNTIKGYMCGQLNATKDTITFNNKMIVGWGPNKKEYYYSRLTDADGHILKQKNFKMAIDKVTGVISHVDKSLYLGLFFGEDINEFYGIGANFTYTPVEVIDNKLDSYTFFYANSDDDEASKELKVKGYFEGKDFFIKGMNPKYPDAWMKGTLVGKDKVRFLSRQMAKLLKTDDPIVMLVTSPKGKDDFNIHGGFEMTLSADKSTFTGLSSGDMVMSNVQLNIDQTKTLMQSYKLFTLRHNELKPATPKAPEYYGYSGDSKEFIFILPSKGTDETVLDTDFMTFRIYVDEKPYTFKKSIYSNLRSDEDLTDIPYTFHDYNNIYKSDFKRYIYFREIDSNTKTLAVEATYSVKGKSNVSKRLVYNIKSNTSEVVSGIEHPTHMRQIKSVSYYDMTGRRMQKIAKGVAIKVVTYNNGEVESFKTIQ